jgi:hypothetical protein
MGSPPCWSDASRQGVYSISSNDQSLVAFGTVLMICFQLESIHATLASRSHHNPYFLARPSQTDPNAYEIGAVEEYEKFFEGLAPTHVSLTRLFLCACTIPDNLFAESRRFHRSISSPGESWMASP